VAVVVPFTAAVLLAAVVLLVAVLPAAVADQAHLAAVPDTDRTAEIS
jgi:hypothetical protein